MVDCVVDCGHSRVRMVAMEEWLSKASAMKTLARPPERPSRTRLSRSLLKDQQTRRGRQGRGHVVRFKVDAPVPRPDGPVRLARDCSRILETQVERTPDAVRSEIQASLSLSRRLNQQGAEPFALGHRYRRPTILLPRQM